MDLQFLDATAMAELVRNKEVKPTELVENTIKCIEEINPAINAVISEMFEIKVKDIVYEKRFIMTGDIIFQIIILNL